MKLHSLARGCFTRTGRTDSSGIEGKHRIQAVHHVLMNAPPQPWKLVSCALVIVATGGPLTLQTHELAPHPLWGKV